MIINEKGQLNELCGRYKGLGLMEARERILRDLEKEERVEKVEQLEQTVGSCWRCNTPVEYIVTDQWFINTLKHKKKLIEIGGKVNWYPKFMRTRFDNWVKNLGWDWAISRQRYYGVPIPVWYCKCGEVIVASEKELPVDPLEVKKKCSKCGKHAVGENDVFDTWMTSSNSPEVALRWLENPDLYKKIAPMSLRPQSHDIIRTWAFYTILKSYLLFNRIPWKDIIINTFVLDPKGRGMSKSKGNAVWADELIEKYGVDVFRYWVGNANLGNDLPFNEQELIAGKRFLTKIWNASRFVFMNLKDFDGEKPSKLEAIDRYMLMKTKEVVEKVKKNYENYNISGGKKLAEDFFWHNFCDNYLEVVKKRIYQGKKGKQSAQYSLYVSLLGVLKLIAPVMPFITEEIFKSYYKDEKEKSIHLSEFLDVDVKGEKGVVEAGDLFLEILSRVRQAKSDAKKAMNSECVLSLSKKDLDKLGEMVSDLQDVCVAKEIKEGRFGVGFG